MLSGFIRIWRMNWQSPVEGNLILSIKILNVSTLPPSNSICRNLSDRNVHSFGQVGYKLFIVTLFVIMENWKQCKCPSINS